MTTEEKRSATGPASVLATAGLALPVSAFLYVNYWHATIQAFDKVASHFISWPYITLVLAIAFLLLFKEPLSAAIGRIHRVKGLGGEVELEVQPPVKVEPPSATDRESRAEQIGTQLTEATPEASGPVHLPDQVVETLRALGEPVPEIQTMQQASEFAGRMLAKATFAYEDAQLWKFHYLSFFLVPNSKLILRWLQGQRFAHRSLYEQEWQMTLPDPVARAIVLNVLAAHGLIEAVGDVFSVTRQGDAFLSFIERNNAWHQAAFAAGEKLVFIPPIYPPREGE